MLASFDLAVLGGEYQKAVIFPRGLLCRHFDLFFLLGKLLLTSSMAWGMGVLIRNRMALIHWGGSRNLHVLSLHSLLD